MSRPPSTSSKVPKHLFRTPPPRDFVEQILRSCGLRGLEDLKQFSKDDLTSGISTAEEWLPLLEPYYLPCKAARFFTETLTTEKIVTIMRHIVRPHGYDLIVQEKTAQKVKQTLYQIQPVWSATDLSGVNLTVDFL